MRRLSRKLIQDSIISENRGNIKAFARLYAFFPQVSPLPPFKKQVLVCYTVPNPNELCESTTKGGLF